jgi:O-antigen/teichoic acid export membrane protein
MLKYNLIANYAGQLVTVALGIVMVPIYVRQLGVEAYGLIALIAVLVAWAQILDLGLSPTLCRELAALRGGIGSQQEVSLLLQSLEKFVCGVCVVLIALSIYAAPYFAQQWLNAKTLPAHEIHAAFVLMMMMVSARCMSALYRGGLVGTDRQVVLNVIVVTFALVRSVLVVPVISFCPHVEVFFLWQLGAIIGEAVTMRILLGRAISAPFFTKRFSPALLVARAKLSLSIAFSAFVWASTTQIDKVILSKILPLSGFGVFSMATLLASGIMLLATPIQQAFIPRFTIESVGNSKRLFSMYLLATEITSVAVIPVAVIFACVPEVVFRLWSASAPSTPEAFRVLQCYSIGNACASIAALAFLIQYAKGNLSLHLKGNVGFFLVLVPAIVYGAFHQGATGVAYAWLGLNVFMVAVWVAIVHRKFLPGINAMWYRGVTARLALASMVGVALHYADLSSFSRLGLFFVLAGTWIVMVLAIVAASPMMQRKALDLAGRLVLS